VLIVEDLGARMGKHFALEGVSFALAPGEILAVLGPNGSGKSTLLRLLAGLATPTAGSIGWSGTRLSEAARVIVPPPRRGIGLLLQQGVLFPHLRVGENVALGLGPSGEGEAGARRVNDALTTARIGHLAFARVQRLSGGEIQRVALARALVQTPEVMLLDEPFHSLDSPVKASIMDEIRGLVKERSLCAVLVTHDADEASAVADRVLLLREGRKVQEGTLDAIYRSPVDGWAARFLGEVGSVDAATAAAAGITLPPGFEGPTAWFRPEALLLDPTDAQTDLEDPRPGLAVTAVRRCRALTEVTVALPGGALLIGRCVDTSLAVGQRARGRLAWTLPPSTKMEGARPS